MALLKCSEADNTTSVKPSKTAQENMEPNESNKKQPQKSKKKLFIVLIALLLVAALIVGYFALFTDVFKKKNEENVTIATPTATLTPTPTPTPVYKFNGQIVKVGNTVIYGSYEQDNDISNGQETIEWRVLAIEDNKALIISEYALDSKPYNIDSEETTWEECSIRTWLNENFLNTVFSTEEQAYIQSSKVTTEDNPSYETKGGNDTTDKVFLLSISEANKYFSSDEERKCVPTAYAIAQGANTNGSGYTIDGEATCWWWLRSPGERQYAAATVSNEGPVLYYGAYDWTEFTAVRPALWISLDD